MFAHKIVNKPRLQTGISSGKLFYDVGCLLMIWECSLTIGLKSWFWMGKMR